MSYNRGPSGGSYYPQGRTGNNGGGGGYSVMSENDDYSRADTYTMGDATYGYSGQSVQSGYPGGGGGGDRVHNQSQQTSSSREFAYSTQSSGSRTNPNLAASMGSRSHLTQANSYSNSHRNSRLSYDGVSQVSMVSNQRKATSSTGQFNDNSSYCGTVQSTQTSHTYDTYNTQTTTLAHGGRGRCPYQIEFSVQNSGKSVSSSKRLIHFRFGFADPNALSSGKLGIECRGREHDVLISWSITGGKRSITVDGREISYSAGKRANAARRADILEAAWGMPGDHVCQVICYAYKPAAGSPEKRDRNWKQYNLTIDGRSFFELPQIFDLGARGLRRKSKVGGGAPSTITTGGGDGDDVSGVSLTPSAAEQREMKNNIQSKIEAQRRLMDARKKASNQYKQQYAQDEKSVMSERSYSSYKSAGSKSTMSNLIDLADSCTISEMSHSTGSRRSSGNDDSTHAPQVFSTAPSELNDAKLRKNNNATSQHPPPAQQPHLIAKQQSMPPNGMKPKPLPPSSAQSYPQVPPQHARQNPNEAHSHAPVPVVPALPPVPPTQSHQPQTRPAPSTQPAQLMQPTQSTQPANPIPTQQLSVFVPQQPPTYDQITRDILGAYDGQDANAANGAIGANGQEVQHVVPKQAPVLANQGNQTIQSNQGNQIHAVNGSNALAPAAPRLVQNSQPPRQLQQHQQHQPHQQHQQHQMHPHPHHPQSKAGATTSVEQGINKWGYF